MRKTSGWAISLWVCYTPLKQIRLCSEPCFTVTTPCISYQSRGQHLSTVSLLMLWRKVKVLLPGMFQGGLDSTVLQHGDCAVASADNTLCYYASEAATASSFSQVGVCPCGGVAHLTIHLTPRA